MITIKQAERAIEMLENFNAGNLRGQWVDGYERREYVVYSYAEPIARQEGDSVEHRWITQEKFSQTTSRHTAVARRAWQWRTR